MSGGREASGRSGRLEAAGVDALRVRPQRVVPPLVRVDLERVRRLADEERSRVRGARRRVDARRVRRALSRAAHDALRVDERSGEVVAAAAAQRRREERDVEDGEHREEEHDEEHVVAQVADGGEDRVDDVAQHRHHRHRAQRPEHAEEAEQLHAPELVESERGEDDRQPAADDDQAVERVPRRAEVRVLRRAAAEGDELDHELDREHHVEDQLEVAHERRRRRWQPRHLHRHHESVGANRQQDDSIKPARLREPPAHPPHEVRRLLVPLLERLHRVFTDVLVVHRPLQREPPRTPTAVCAAAAAARRLGLRREDKVALRVHGVVERVRLRCCAAGAVAVAVAITVAAAAAAAVGGGRVFGDLELRRRRRQPRRPTDRAARTAAVGSGSGGRTLSLRLSLEARALRRHRKNVLGCRAALAAAAAAAAIISAVAAVERHPRLWRDARRRRRRARAHLGVDVKLRRRVRTISRRRRRPQPALVRRRRRVQECGRQ